MGTKGEPTSPARVALTRERVLLAAVDLADKGGIAALSMRKLAQLLGVEAMSLYNHVVSKQDVLDGMVDLIAAQISMPPVDAQWRAAMRERATSAHKVLVRHPWATLLIVSRVNIGPAMLRHIDATLGCFVKAGFSYALADHAWNAVDSHVYGFTLQELSFPFAPQAYVDEAKAYLPQIPADTYPYLRALTQMVAERAYDGRPAFEFGLDLILDGLEALLTKSLLTKNLPATP